MSYMKLLGMSMFVNLFTHSPNCFSPLMCKARSSGTGHNDYNMMWVTAVISLMVQSCPIV